MRDLQMEHRGYRQKIIISRLMRKQKKKTMIRILNFYKKLIAPQERNAGNFRRKDSVPGRG